jgi:hypothetical protein
MMFGHCLGITHMWRFCCCVVALSASPALAPGALGQSVPYVARDRAFPQPRQERHRNERRHPNGLSARDIEPSRLGPAPRAFLYHCDAPAGFYPYIPACRTAWRIVPAGGHR